MKGVDGRTSRGEGEESIHIHQKRERERNCGGEKLRRCTNLNSNRATLEFRVEEDRGKWRFGLSIIHASVYVQIRGGEGYHTRIHVCKRDK